MHIVGLVFTEMNETYDRSLLELYMYIPCALFLQGCIIRLYSKVGEMSSPWLRKIKSSYDVTDTSLISDVI